MGKRAKIVVVALLIAAVIGLAGWYLSQVSIPVLQPRGPVADQEFRLMILITLIMLIVVIPVFALLIGIIWRYRENAHPNAVYAPEWSHSRVLEAFWWLIPAGIIVVLAIVTWRATYALDPYKELKSSQPSIPVQVVALDWKWLFIYPTLHIASINQLEMPIKQPLHLYITADAPMNSFWIPQLAGQIYAMQGMQTQLNIMADQSGSYIGRSANISGVGFAGMQFTAKAVSKQVFNQWVATAAKQPRLTTARYQQLARPSSYTPVTTYSKPAANLFNSVISSYMPSKSMGGM